LANKEVVNLTAEEYSLEPVFGENDIYDTSSNTLTGNTTSSDTALNILARIDFTYTKEIENLAVVRRFIAHVQQSRKACGLHPWDAISIEVNSDDFDIISSTQKYIQQRLECSVNAKSELPADRTFTSPDEEDSRCITYSILRI
jgi:hypothetical protein